MHRRNVITHSPSERQIDYRLAEYSLHMRDLACRLDDLCKGGGFRATADSLEDLERLLEPVRRVQERLEREVMAQRLNLRSKQAGAALG